MFTALKRLGAILALTGLPWMAQAQESIKVGTFVPEQSTGVAGVIKPWMEAVAADVGSGARLQAFWGGTLGKDPFKQFELVQNGVADVTWVLPGYTAGQFPEMSLFELPFLFRNANEASVVGWKLFEKGLLTGFDGVHLVGFFTTESNALYMAKGIDSLDSLKGLKVRSVGPVHARFLEAFGASAQTLSSAEMNEALNRGTIDGVIQGWTGLKTFKTLPLIGQAYDVPVGTIPFLLLMNKAKWDKLPPAVQASIMKHGGLQMAQAGARAYTSAGEKVEQEARGQGRIGFAAPTQAQIDSYQDRIKAIHDWWIDQAPNGKAVYGATLAALAELRAGK